MWFHVQDTPRIPVWSSRGFLVSSGVVVILEVGVAVIVFIPLFLPLDTASTTNKYNVFSKGADIDNIYVTAFTFNLPHILFSEYND